MAQQDETPSAAQSVEQLADSLSQAANALHSRIKSALGKRSDQTPATISADEARTLFDQEVALRQQANYLYTQAAGAIVAGLGASRQSVLGVAAAASQKIERIDATKDLIDHCTDLLSLAGAVVAGKPEKILSAVKNIKAGFDRQERPPTNA